MEEQNQQEAVRRLRETLAAVEKQFGKGAIMNLGEQPPSGAVDTISTGSVGVDMALGVGGFPRGRIIEVFGPESSGKTTLALQALAQVHRRGGMGAFIDAEHALDAAYARALGVNLDHLLISQPDSGEQALEICETLVRSGAVDLVVLDSVAALVPRAEIEGEMGDAHMGLQARLMSQAMRKLTGIAHRTGCCLVFINQLRQKIGVTFGNPEVTTGGNALKFYASVRVEVRRIGAIKDATDVVGNRTRIKVVKNKLAPPFREVEVDVLYGKGIWPAADLLDRGIEAEVLQRAGSWISWGARQLGQGRDKAARLLDAEPTLAAALYDAVMAVARGECPPPPPEPKTESPTSTPAAGAPGQASSEPARPDKASGREAPSPSAKGKGKKAAA